MADHTARARRLERAAERMVAARAARDQEIREAKDEGMPVTHIAAAVGLDRTQVHRIIRENGSKA